ncbi:hypothetical protein QBC36DRAFT_191311 [Triangularia setosa]|uniref:Uncharacterized protein n=1 Tax=Triangularia setosa TaxID=2587417 RepID=A0AAN6W4H4_9PEZI|nr:hypothetical protein QBC36DRAFT_191311 [Podospora setosa]
MADQELEFSSLVACSYEVGNMLTIPRSVDSFKWRDDEIRLLRVKIRMLQQPWNLSCCMAVEILRGSSDEVEETAIIKLFGRHFAVQQRSNQGFRPLG